MFVFPLIERFLQLNRCYSKRMDQIVMTILRNLVLASVYSNNKIIYWDDWTMLTAKICVMSGFSIGLFSIVDSIISMNVTDKILLRFSFSFFSFFILSVWNSSISCDERHTFLLHERISLHFSYLIVHICCFIITLNYKLLSN